MNLINLTELTKDQVAKIFNVATKLKEAPERYTELLKGKCVVLFFPESSIRTRVTFEKGILTLGGTTILFPPASLDKREEIEDVVHYLENWADALIVRHGDHAKIEAMGRYSRIPVINAMSAQSHPCEILSDLFSIEARRGAFEKLKYTFVGENANIGRTWMEAAETFKFELCHVHLESSRFKPDSPYYAFHTALDPVLPGSDVVLTDSLPPELRTLAYTEKYQITKARMANARPGALLNPCPPFYRGEEVSEDAIHSESFVGYDFKESLLYVQQAILLQCMGVEC